MSEINVLKSVLGETFDLWQALNKYVLSKYPKGIESNTVKLVIIMVELKSIYNQYFDKYETNEIN